MVDPLNHDLGLADRAWAELFSARSFDEATRLHKEIIHSSDSLSLALHCSSTGHQFDGVTSDLMAVFTAKSPLEQLQMMTSALRKAMATLSSLKLKPLLERGTSTEQGENATMEIYINCTIISPPLPAVDASLAAVSFDELLPVLVLTLLHRLSPSALARLHVHCMFLADYTPPFLSPGWHGYSLAAFTSALHIISKL